MNISVLENLLNLPDSSESLTLLTCGKNQFLQVNLVFGSAWMELFQPCAPRELHLKVLREAWLAKAFPKLPP